MVFFERFRAFCHHARARHFATMANEGANTNARAVNGTMQSPASRVKTMWRTEREEAKATAMEAFRIDALRDGSDLEHVREFYIDPRDKARMRWDQIACVFVLYNVAILPFDAAFWIDVDSVLVRAARGVGYAIDVFFGVDIVLNFFTAYYDKSERLVASRREIAKHYLKTSFALDILGSFPYELVINGSSRSLAAVVKLPRLLRVRRVYSFLDKRESKSVVLFRIAHLAVFVIFTIHFVACAWFIICDGDRRESMTSNSPFTSDADETAFWCTRDMSTMARYVFATNDAVSFLLGNGVAETISASSTLAGETVILLLSGVLYCVVFGNVASLVNSLMSRNEVFRARMQVVNDAMRYMQVDDDLSNRVRQYYEYLWLRYRDVKVGSMAIAQDLPQSLKHELLLHFHAEVLRRVPMFADVCDPATVLFIVSKLQTEIALPGDLLTRRGEPTRGMFFLSRGSVEVLLYVSPDVNGKERLGSTAESRYSEFTSMQRQRRSSRWQSDKIQDVSISDANPILRDGDYFGERGLLLGEVASASVLARTFCELHVLTSDDFDVILERAPEIEEYMIRARLELFRESAPVTASSPAEETTEDEIKRQLTATRAMRRERLSSRIGLAREPLVSPSGARASVDARLDVPHDVAARLDRIESALSDVRRSIRARRRL